MKADCVLFFLFVSKSIVDGLNGNSKHKLTVAAGRKLNPSFDPDMSRTFAPLTKVEGKAFRPAEECKTILELDGGTTGAKSVMKYQKRESNRKVRNYHCWVRGADETLSSLKYESQDKFMKGNDGFMSMYHIYSCFEMGCAVDWLQENFLQLFFLQKQMRQPSHIFLQSSRRQQLCAYAHFVVACQ